jgi:hypothetical protein
MRRYVVYLLSLVVIDLAGLWHPTGWSKLSDHEVLNDSAEAKGTRRTLREVTERTLMVFSSGIEHSPH